MTRYALLIEASKAKGQKEIAGCARDVERMKTWLRSAEGGAWNDSEIKVLNNPSCVEINLAKGLLNLADFAVATFSGHGRIVEDRSGARSQKITLGSGEEIDLLDLKPTSGKSILLCDACREIHRPSQIWLSTREIRVKCARLAERYSREHFRAEYERLVESAPRGMFTMYSCSPGQCAGDDPLNGGTFTDALLGLASRWCETASAHDALTIDVAFALARDATARRSRTVDPKEPQDPLGGPSQRSGNPFPFAISLK